MTRRERPPAVTRHLNSLLWLPVATAALFGWFLVTEDVPASRPERLDPATEFAADGRVLRRKPGGTVDVRYTNPVTEQRVTAELYAWDGDLVPARGGTVRLIVDRDDPLDVVADGDVMPLSTNLVVYVAWIGGAALPALMRRYAVRRTERLVAAPAASFSMVGVLTPHRRRTRCTLHLYPLDAPVGSPPVCSVPVLTTGQARIAPLLFPVEVKGSPRPLGRVVARSGDALLWPASRAGRRSDHPCPPGPARPIVPLEGAPAVRRTLPSLSPGALRTEGAVAGVTLGLLAVVVAVTAYNGGKAGEVLAEGRLVLGEIVEHEGEDDVVVLKYSEGGAVRTTRASVDFASDYRKGLRYPVRLDPDDPARSRLPAEPYDAAEPIAWAVGPAVLGLGLLLNRWRDWRRNRATARQGPCWHAWVRGGGEADDLVVCDEGGTAVCGAVVPGNTYRAATPIPVVVAGTVEPGNPIAMWMADDRPLTVVQPATNGSSGRAARQWPWIRRPFDRRRQ